MQDTALDEGMLSIVMQYGLAAGACVAVIFLWRALLAAHKGRVDDLAERANLQSETNLALERISVATHANVEKLSSELTLIKEKIDGLMRLNQERG